MRLGSKSRALKIFKDKILSVQVDILTLELSAKILMPGRFDLMLKVIEPIPDRRSLKLIGPSLHDESWQEAPADVANIFQSGIFT